MSDRSSIISISTRMAASEADTEGYEDRDPVDYHVDTRKYYIPDGENVGLGWPVNDHFDYKQLGYIPSSCSREDTPLPNRRHDSSERRNSSSNGESIYNNRLHGDNSIHRNENQYNGGAENASSSSNSNSSTDTSEGYDDETDMAFVPAALSRPASIFSLSRVSFNSQLAELTSIKLPNAVSLSARISSMPDSAAAARALSDSAEQIRLWIRNALGVLRGLDAEDDVEWAAAAGREGLEEVDKAINRFEKVIKVYILSVEELQMRSDISTLPNADLTRNVVDMEAVLREWQKIKDALDGIKNQVEIAMEWEELWNHVLGAGIGQEMDNLARLVFEMEEKRHQSVAADASSDTGPSIDLDELKTIVEESPASAKQSADSRYSLHGPFSSNSSVHPSPIVANVEDSLLALFARMQPLRASLDFLPMRLAVFHSRGDRLFPSACSILDARRDALETQWKKLDADAEALRRELGEDRWLLVFRNAGRQALKMCESVSRTMEKLRSAIYSGEQRTDAPAVARKIESYEAKKTHYGPAIERVLAIVDRGVLDRLTVNGEILGLQSDMKRRWTALQLEMRDMDATLLDMNVNMRNQQLRDSISTILSSEQSLVSSLVETPRSSSASSMSARSSFQNHSTPMRRVNGFLKSSIPRSVPSGSRSSPLVQPLRPISPTLTPVPFLRQFKAPSDKPRWNGSTNTRGSGIGLNFSLEVSSSRSETSSPRTATPGSAPSKIPGPRSLSRGSQSPAGLARSPARPGPTRRVSTPAASPLPSRLPSSHVGVKTPRSNLSHVRAFTSPMPSKRNELLPAKPTDDTDAGSERSIETKRTVRAPSALAAPSGRKSVMRSQSRAMETGGRLSRTEARAASQDGRPRWK